MRTKVALYTVLALFLVFNYGCSSTGGPADSAKTITPEATNAQNAIDKAKAALKKAEEGGYAWRDTGDMIKSAEDALKDGLYDKAAQLANDAYEETELGKKQQEKQKKMLKEKFG